MFKCVDCLDKGIRWILVAAALVVGVGFGYWYGNLVGVEQGRDAERQIVKQAREAEARAAAKAANPFDGSSTNPFSESVNPLENVKTNPFQ